VVLQAHMDMVPQATADKPQDFLKDQITAYVKGGYLTADRTTPGADDGIGVAIIMALLQDKDIEHGPIEALFTVDEEDGFTGVNGLKAGVLKGSYLRHRLCPARDRGIVRLMQLPISFFPRTFSGSA